VSFLASPLSLSGSIDDSNHPLGSGMDMDVPDLHRLLVTPLMSVKGLDQIKLKPKQLGGKAAVHANVNLIHENLALTQEFEPGKAGRRDLNRNQGRKFCTGVDR
jgi:hypothetical protein